MKIILAQGNPEPEYAGTRHNVGFHIVSQYADTHNCAFNLKTKFQAEIAEMTFNNETVLLVKPTTYYNETGLSARLIIDFYKVDPAQDLLVLHDDLALPFGIIRTREKGSDAGNNGVKSLNTHVGEAYKRIRIGIWNDLRDHMDAKDFVLAKFSQDEAVVLPEIIQKTHQIIDGFLDELFTASTV